MKRILEELKNIQNEESRIGSLKRFLKSEKRDNFYLTRNNKQYSYMDVCVEVDIIRDTVILIDFTVDAKLLRDQEEVNMGLEEVEYLFYSLHYNNIMHLLNDGRCADVYIRYNLKQYGYVAASRIRSFKEL